MAGPGLTKGTTYLQPDGGGDGVERVLAVVRANNVLVD